MLLLAACSEAPPRPAVVTAGDEVEVQRVVDGDTIRARVNGTEERVRLIGVDAPETTSGPECFGPEATRILTELLAGGRVRLVRQRSERDRFGRLLRDIYRAGDGLFVNAELVRRGAARVLEIRPDTLHAAQLRGLELGAQAAQTGLWRACPTG